MKILFLLLFIFSSHAFAKTGVGIMIGDPTAVSIKHFIGKEAIDGGLAFGHHEIVVFGDYLKHFPGKLGKQNEFVANLIPYVGLGPLFAFSNGNEDHHHHIINDDDDNFAFGVRIPFGVEFMFTEVPVGVSLEIVPGAVVVPETDAMVQGGLAVRYYF